MGLNRFYTYNGQILKTADGNPIGYEYIPYPANPSYRWLFNDTLADEVASTSWPTTLNYKFTSGGGPGGDFYCIERNAPSAFYITLTDASIVSGGQKTLAFWIYWPNASWTIYGGWGGMTSNGSPMQIQSKAATVLSIYSAFSDIPITYNAWHHIAISQDFDSTTNNAKVYLDGVLKQTISIASSAEKITLGNYLSHTGKYALTYIYNRILSLEEVQKLYTEGGGTV